MSKPFDTHKAQYSQTHVPAVLMIATGALILLPWIGNALVLHLYPDLALKALMHAIRPFGLYALVLLFLVWISAWGNPAYPRIQKHFVNVYSIVMLAAAVREQIYYYQH